MYKSVPPEDYTTCGSAVWLRSTLMTFWFPVVNTFSRNTPIMSDVNAVSIFQDSTLPPSDSSHSVNNSPTSWKPRIALLSNITYPIFNIKIDDFACLMVTRICKWHWGSCKTCNFTWMLLGTCLILVIFIYVTINCFCKNRLPNIKYGSVIKVNNFVCYNQWYKIFLLPSAVMVDGGETKQFSELHCGRVWRSVGHAGGTSLRYYQGNDSIEVIKLNVSFILLFIFWMPLSMSLC